MDVQLTAGERLFGSEPEIPAPPERWTDFRLEWREGYKVGWEVGPGRETPSLKFQTRYSPLSGARGAAFKAGKEAGRSAKRALIAELWPVVQQRGREHTQVVNNWPRTGWAYQGAFFYFFGTGKAPIASPLVEEV